MRTFAVDYYCKRTILRLASSKILTPHPHPPLRPASVYPLHRLCCGGRTHSQGGEGGWGSIFWKTQDTALYSTNIESSLIFACRSTLLYGVKIHRLPGHGPAVLLQHGLLCTSSSWLISGNQIFIEIQRRLPRLFFNSSLPYIRFFFAGSDYPEMNVLRLKMNFVLCSKINKYNLILKRKICPNPTLFRI